ncbi:WD40 repeat-like protein [Clavulina sp. PMI_390]|nr:WD40 repeat-like protein [Clavulina sp. PMI_390]
MLYGERRLKFNICNLSTSFLPNSLVPELPALVQEKIGEALSYTCHFWTSHYAQGPGEPDSAVEIVRTLLSTTQLFHWLEVMSITGVFPLQSLSLISGQVRYVIKSEIAAEVAEAVHFISYYAIPIAQSAPHIYLSAMPFIPTSSALWLLCKQFTRTVSVSSGHMVTWPILRHVLEHKDKVEYVAVSTQNIAAAGFSNGTIFLWNCQTGEQHGKPLTGHTGGVRSVAFSPDGAVLASGSDDRTIRLLWDLNTHSVKGQPLIGHTNSVTSVALSPDRAVLASGSDDRTIRLWDVNTQSAKGDPFGVTGVTIYSLTFFHDGKLLASGAADGSIYLWDLSTFLPSNIVLPLPVLEASCLTPTWLDLTRLNNGWVKGPNGELVLWVPPHYRTHLSYSGLVTALGKDPSEIIKLNFDHMVMGEQWAQCYTLQSN